MVRLKSSIEARERPADNGDVLEGHGGGALEPASKLADWLSSLEQRYHLHPADADRLWTIVAAVGARISPNAVRRNRIRRRDQAIRVVAVEFYSGLSSRRAQAIALAADLARATTLAAPSSPLNRALAEVLDLSGGKPLEMRALQDILAGISI